MVGVYSLPGFIMKANTQTVHMPPTKAPWAAKEQAGLLSHKEVCRVLHNQNSSVIPAGISSDGSQPQHTDPVLTLPGNPQETQT